MVLKTNVVDVAVEELTEGVLAIEELVVEEDRRIEELLLENETTVCRLVAGDVDVVDGKLLRVLVFVN